MSKRCIATVLIAACCFGGIYGFAQEPSTSKPACRRNTTSLTHFAATIAEAFQIKPPQKAEPSLGWVRDKIRELSPGPIDRVVIYNPDAVAQWLIEKYPEMFKPVVEQTQIRLPMVTMLPSVTPVCFGTMYTGAAPTVHGIQQYAKPVIRIDTLFDALVRSGKRAAIVASPGSSMASIFLDRKIDYFAPRSAEACLQKARELIEEDKHDFLVVYNGNYDSTMHRYGTESPESLKQLRFQVEGFDALVKCIHKNWTAHNTLITFSTDHGVHDEMANGKTVGKHGTDRPEDVNIVHYLGVIPAERTTAAPAGFTTLFDGRTLNGWKIKCKPADNDVAAKFWTVEHGAIMANSLGHKDHDYVWLTTDCEFADFELRLCFQTERGISGNSGIQIRSRYDDVAGYLDGPQLDINPPGPWRSGMIWDETRGSQRWLFPKVPQGKWVDESMAPKGFKFFYADQGSGWNDLRIVVQGFKVKAWLNDIQVTDYDGSGELNDAIHREHNVGVKGIIALQIHTHDELKIRFKDLFVKEL